MRVFTRFSDLQSPILAGRPETARESTRCHATMPLRQRDTCEPMRAPIPPNTAAPTAAPSTYAASNAGILIAGRMDEDQSGSDADESADDQAGNGGAPALQGRAR